jgi:hypothetical protein
MKTLLQPVLQDLENVNAPSEGAWGAPHDAKWTH